MGLILTLVFGGDIWRLRRSKASVFRCVGTHVVLWLISLASAEWLEGPTHGWSVGLMPLLCTPVLIIAAHVVHPEPWYAFLCSGTAKRASPRRRSARVPRDTIWARVFLIAVSQYHQPLLYQCAIGKRRACWCVCFWTTWMESTAFSGWKVRAWGVW